MSEKQQKQVLIPELDKYKVDRKNEQGEVIGWKYDIPLGDLITILTKERAKWWFCKNDALIWLCTEMLNLASIETQEEVTVWEK